MDLRLETRLALRNVGRNVRRTGLTVAAAAFAVFLTVFFVALTDGTHGKMIEDSVRVHSGHLTLSGPGYLDEQTLEHSLAFDPAMAAMLDEAEGVVGWAPRIQSFALVSKQENSHGVAVLGVDPAREGDVSTLPERVYQGAFLDVDQSQQILLGERLARSLGAKLGDEILLYGLAYSLESAYELFEVAGLLRLPEPELERRLAVVSLADARDFYVYGDRLSEIALLTRDAEQSESVQAELAAALEGRVEPAAPIAIHTWREVMPELEQFLILDRAGMVVLLVILVIVVGFGILNTILMAVLERARELGVMLALGLQPAAIFRVVYLESLLLAAAGIALGLALSIPCVLWLAAHPIPLSGELGEVSKLIGAEPVVTWRLKAENPIRSIETMIGVALLAALYPALKASRARPVDALRSL